MSNRLFAKHAYTSLAEKNDQELFELKLPSSIRIQSVPFDPKTYQIEDPVVFKNDAGVLTERDCAVDNIVRYRQCEKVTDNNSLGLDIQQKVSERNYF